MQVLFFETGFPEVELPILGFSIRECTHEVDRILAGIAGCSELSAVAAYGTGEAGQTQIGERIRFNILADLLHGMT